MSCTTFCNVLPFFGTVFIILRERKKTYTELVSKSPIKKELFSP